MEFTVNGNPYQHNGEGTILSLLESMGVDPAKVAIVVNDAIIKRETLDSVELANGDQIEIITFAGGG